MSILPTMDDFKCALNDEVDPVINCPNDIIANIGQEPDDCTANVQYQVVSADGCAMRSITRKIGKNSNNFRATHDRIDVKSIFDAQIGILKHGYIAIDKSGRSAACSFDVKVQHPITCEMYTPGECIDGVKNCYFDQDKGDHVCEIICNEYASSYQVSWSYPEKSCYDQPLMIDVSVKAKCIKDITLTKSDNPGTILLSDYDLKKCKGGDELQLIVSLLHGDTIVGTCESTKEADPERIRSEEISDSPNLFRDVDRSEIALLASIGTFAIGSLLIIFKRRRCQYLPCSQKSAGDNRRDSSTRTSSSQS